MGCGFASSIRKLISSYANTCANNGGRRTQPQDQSSRTPLRLQQILRRAEQAGSHLGTLCQTIHRKQGDYGIRRILGVLPLAKRYGPAAVDDACVAAR